jgi:L,D-transpeptidase YbiS
MSIGPIPEKTSSLPLTPSIAYDLEKWEECEKLCSGIADIAPPARILINISKQMLFLIQPKKPVRCYPISTAINGAGQKKESYKTPLGLHHIHEKIGEGADPYDIFESRVLIHKKALPEAGGKAIVGRILRLKGLEEGFNREGDVDTYERYIYIHGTNSTESFIQDKGVPKSSGCIRMKPKQVVSLFRQIPTKTLVYIYV